MLTNELISTIENDTSWAKECPVEEHAVKALERLKNEWKFSDDELQQLYSTELKQYLWTIDSDNAMLYKVQKLNAITWKLLKTRLEQAKETKESSDSSWFKNMIYWCIWVDKKIESNTTGKNIAKWVIDELASIPEMMCEIVKHPIDFWQWLYVALVKNFAQTMNAIKNSYTDVFQWSETPEKAYKTGRSAVNIILTLLPWFIGKKLLQIGKTTGKRGVVLWKWAWKIGQKVLPRTSEKIVKWAKIAAETTKKWVNGLQKTKAVNASRATIQKWKNIVNSWKNAANNTINKTRARAEKSLITNNMITALAWDILKLPIRAWKYAWKKLDDIVPNALKPKVIKDYRALMSSRLELATARTELISYTQKWQKNINKGQRSFVQWQLNRQNKISDLLAKTTQAKQTFVWTIVWTWIIWLHEIDKSIDVVENNEMQKKIDAYAEEIAANTVTRDVDIESCGVQSGSDAIDTSCLDMPQLTDVEDRSKISIDITGLASWTWTKQKNEALALKRAENAKQQIIEAYAIPEDFQWFTTNMYRQETPVEGKTPEDFQWVRVTVRENNWENNIV